MENYTFVAIPPPTENNIYHKLKIRTKCKNYWRYTNDECTYC